MNDAVHERFAIAALAYLALLAGFIPSFYSAAYHGFAESLQDAVILNLMTASMLFIPTFASVLVLKINAMRFVASSTVIYAMYRIWASHNQNNSLEMALKISLALAGTFLLAAALCYVSDKAFRKTIKILLAMVVGWIVSIPLVAWFQSDSAQQTTLSLDSIFKEPPKAVVVLILDEFSPESASIIKNAMANTDHVLHFRTSVKAGKSTINAIPSMLTSVRHDEVVVCGFTRLCGKTPFDMSKLKAAQPNTDVVGFYHPYCAIQGLRSCWKAEANQLGNSSSIFSYLLRLVERVPLINIVMKDNHSKATNVNETYQNIRDDITKHALAAPIWNEGGLLYIHQLLPHPIGFGVKRRLKDEYEENLLKASDFVGALSKSLQKRFGSNYALIVTTDHPLRKGMWCANEVYANDNCNNENLPETEMIPFLLSSHALLEVKIPNTNVGIFSLSQ